MATTSKQQQRVPSVARMLRDIATPEGFEREVRTEPKTEWYPAYKVLTLKSEDIEIVIEFSQGRDGYFLACGHVSFDTADGRRSFDRYGVEDSFYIDNPAKALGKEKLWEHQRVVRGAKLGTVVSGAGYRGNTPNRKWVDEVVIAWDEGETTTYTEAQVKRNRIVHADVVEQTNATIRRFIEVRIPEARARIARSERVPTTPFSVTPEDKARVVQRLKTDKQYTFMPGGFGTGYTLTRSARTGGYGAKRAPQLEAFFGVKPIYVSTFDAD